jgi:hypothetical protein
MRLDGKNGANFKEPKPIEHGSNHMKRIYKYGFLAFYSQSENIP